MVPAMQERPTDIMANSSERVSLVRYGRMRSGDSIMPRNMHPDDTTPNAPPMPMVLRNTHENPCTTLGRMRQ